MTKAGCGKPSVKLEAVIDAIECSSDEVYFVLDMESGRSIMIFEDDYADMIEDEEEAKRVEAYKAGADNFIELPTRQDFDEYDAMESFVFEKTSGSDQEKLDNAIRGKGAFRRFRDVVHRLDLADAWYAYRREAIKRYALSWCEDQEIAVVE